MKRLSFLLVFLLLPVVGWGAAAPCSPGTCYVDNNSTGGDGTTTALSGAHAAFATIATVNGYTYAAGDNILFARGGTWREQLTVPSSGSAGNPITFGAYGSGDKPIINGSNIVSSWTTENYTGNTNLNPYPKAFDSFGQELCRTTANVAIPLAPDGTQTADGLIPDATSNTHFWDKDVPGTAATVYTWSVYLYPGTGNGGTDRWVYIGVNTYTSGWGFINYHNANFDLKEGGYLGAQNHDVTARSITHDDVTGWYHVQITFTADTNTANVVMSITPAPDDSGSTTLTGDNTTVAVYAWGGKLEAASAATVIDNRTLYYASYTHAPEQSFYDTTQLRNSSAKTDLVSGRFWVDTGNSRIYLFDNPSGHTVEVGARDIGIYVNGKDYVNTTNIVVTKTDSSGLVYNNATYGISDGIDGSYNYKYGISNLGSDNTEVTNNITVKNGEYSYNGQNGINFNGYSGLHDILVQNNKAHNNGIDPAMQFTTGIHLWGNFGGATGGQSTNLTVENNESYSNKASVIWGFGAGIWIDQWGTGAVVRYNNVHDNDGPGILVENHTGTSVYYNAVKGNGLYFVTGGHPGNANMARGIMIYRNATNNLVYNNVAYGNAVGIAIEGKAGETTMTGNLVKNNISTGNTVRQLRAVLGGENAGGGSGNVYTYNAFGPQATNFIEWGAGVYDNTYVQFATSYGATTYSVITDPLFVSTVTPDFHLQPASPAINAGVNVGLTTDYAGRPVPFGSAPDIGVYEWYPGGIYRGRMGVHWLW